MKYPVLLPNIFDHPFTYESNLNLKIGDFVEVPFGKAKITGVVWDNFEEKNNKKFKVKKIIKKLDVPHIRRKTLDFLNWFARYNVVPKGMALKLALLSGKSTKEFDQSIYKDFNFKIKNNLINLTLEQEKALKEINISNKKF